MQKIKRSETSLSKALKEQKEFKDRMEEIKKVQKKHLLPESKTVRKNIKNLYEAREAAIDFHNHFTKRASEPRHQARQEAEGLKILTPKQMFQRLPIALAQTKAIIQRVY